MPRRIKSAAQSKGEGVGWGGALEDQGHGSQSVCTQCVMGRSFCLEMQHSWCCAREPQLTLY